MKYKVVIIEDELIIRKGLISSIPWDNYDCVVVGEARNGKEGLVVIADVKPDIIVAIDALAAQRMSRLHTTIQVSDTGIVPGSGVGNRRLGINRQTIGIPVYAIGVPTVVDAVTIAGDSMDHLAEALKRESAQGNMFANIVQKMNWEEKRNIIKEVLQPFAGDLIVTPKEIDTLIDDISLVIAASLDAAFHSKIAEEEESRAAVVH